MAVAVLILVSLLLAALSFCGILLICLWDLDIRSQDREQVLGEELSDLRVAQRIQLAAWQAEHDLLAAAREQSDKPES